MHPSLIPTLCGLFIIGSAQMVIWTFVEPTATPSIEGRAIPGLPYTITEVDASGAYAVSDCHEEVNDTASKGFGPDGTIELCNVILRGEKLPMIKRTLNSGPTVVSASFAKRSPTVDPASVLEARMERKFGMEARVVPAQLAPAQLENAISPASSIIITVTSTTTVLSIPESCMPSRSPKPFPLFHAIPNAAPFPGVPLAPAQFPDVPSPSVPFPPAPIPGAQFPGAEVSAMSIVAGMLTEDIAALMSSPTASPLPSNIAEIMVSVLTANASAPGTSPIASGTVGLLHANGSRVTSGPPGPPSPPPTPEEKGGASSSGVGVSVAILAAIGIAYLLA